MKQRETLINVVPQVTKYRDGKEDEGRSGKKDEGLSRANNSIQEQQNCDDVSECGDETSGGASRL